MRKAFDWKRSRIFMLEVEAIPQSFIPQVQIGLSIILYMRSLLLVESFELRLSNQYILVRMITSCLHFAKMCFCQVSVLSRCSLRYLISSWRSFSKCTHRQMTRLWLTKDRPGLSSERAPHKDNTTHFRPKHLKRKQHLVKRPQSGLDTRTYWLTDWLTISRKETLTLTAWYVYYVQRQYIFRFYLSQEGN
jgi:hypothetical protein